MDERTIKAGQEFGHREEREVPHEHIVLYVGIHTRTGEKMVVHRPTHKIGTIYCEPMEDFVNRFYARP